MRYLALILIALLWCGVSAREEDQHFQREGGILVLDEHCFMAALMKYKFVLVFYYGRNKESLEAAKEVVKLEEQLEKNFPDVHVGKVDAEREIEVDRKFPVYELPTLRLFKNGRQFDFHGTRTAEHVLTWVKLAMNVPLQINLASELDDLKKSTCVIVGCFPGKNPEAAFKNFYKVSEYYVYDSKMTLPRFAVVTSAKLGRELGFTSGTITILKNFEDGAKVVYGGDDKDFDNLLKFVESETVPVVYKHNLVQYSNKFHSPSIKYHHVLFISSRDRNYDEVFSSFKEAAKQFQSGGEVAFIHVDTAKEEKLKHLSFYHVKSDKDIPCNRMTKFDKYHSRFVPSQKGLTTNNFVKFTDDVINGRVQRSIRSDESPSDWNNFDVKIIVGNTYSNFVQDKTRTVFMMYYVPKHDKSDAAQPVYNELARQFRSNRTIVFGKMNVATNDGEIDVHTAYPSFKMFTSTGEVLKYTGDVTVESMNSFVMTGGASQVHHDHHEPEGAEYDMDWHDKAHPIDTYQDEEERMEKWAKEEKEILEKAVEHGEPEEPHEDPQHKEEHPLEHLDEEERDPAQMDPKKHADFENHDYVHELGHHSDL